MVVSKAQKEATKKYRELHPESVKFANKRSRDRTRLEVLIHYSIGQPKCECCGEVLMEFLCIDHINGGGSEFRRRKPGTSIYFWLKSNGFPGGYRVLCHNCNQAIGYYGYCPHKEEHDEA